MPDAYIHAAYRHTTYCGDYARPANKTKDMGKVTCPKCIAKLGKAAKNYFGRHSREECQHDETLTTSGGCIIATLTHIGVPMTTKTYTVAFELELLPDTEGDCFMCVTNYGRPSAEGNPPQYAVRNHDGPTLVLCCGFHLEFLLPQWDALVEGRE